MPSNNNRLPPTKGGDGLNNLFSENKDTEGGYQSPLEESSTTSRHPPLYPDLSTRLESLRKSLRKVSIP